MVTLQILVLSFLVRIQVAQQERSSFEDRFFVVKRGHLRPIPKARPLGLYVRYYPEGSSFAIGHI